MKTFISGVFVSLLIFSMAFAQDADIKELATKYQIELPENAGQKVAFKDQWFKAVATFIGNENCAEIEARFDLNNQIVELRKAGIVYYFSPESILSLNLNDGEFLFKNAASFPESTSKELLLVKYNGQVKLLESIHVKVIQPSYNPRIGVGSQEVTIKYESEYFVATNNGIANLELTPGGLNSKKVKQNMVFFGDLKPKIENYIKTNGIDFSSLRYITFIVEEYDRLLILENNQKNSSTSRNK